MTTDDHVHDEFGGPAPRGRARMTEDGIELDQWDRYVLPDPLTGEMRHWTRASTVAKVLPDNYHLNLWKQRSVAVGLARRHDLLALVASVGDPRSDAGKAELNAICTRALEAAGGTERRDLGTALHAFTASHDRGLPQPAPPHLIPDVSAYAGLLRREGLTVIPAYTERVVCVPEWGLAGRLDRAVSCLDNMIRVADVKTGDRADEFGDLEFVVQQGIYVRGLAYGVYNAAQRVWEPFPYAGKLGTDVALIIHLPVGEPDRADVYAFNIADAALYVEQALAVRTSRRAKNLRVPWRDYAAFLRTRMEVTPIDSPTPQYIATTVSDPLADDRDVDLSTEDTPALLSTPVTMAEQAPDPRLELTGYLDDNGQRTYGPHGDAIVAAYERAQAATLDMSQFTGVQNTSEAPEIVERADPYRETLERAALCVTGQFPDPPTLFDLVRAAQHVGELSALWQELHPAGLWSTEVHERAVAREAELEQVSA